MAHYSVFSPQLILEMFTSRKRTENHLIWFHVLFFCFVFLSLMDQVKLFYFLLYHVSAFFLSLEYF